MEIHELQNELDETVDTMAADLAKTIQEDYPALSDEDAVSAARLHIGLQITLPGADAKKAASVYDGAIEIISRAGFGWAARYTEAFVARFRPSYDSALAIGVDPAPVIAAAAQIDLKEARVIVRTFKKMDKAQPVSTGANSGPAPADEDDNGAPVAPDSQGDPFNTDSDRVTVNA